MRKNDVINWATLECAYSYSKKTSPSAERKLKDKSIDAFLRVLYKQTGKSGTKIAMETLWKDIKDRIEKRFGSATARSVLDSSFYRTLIDHGPGLARQYYSEMKRSNTLRREKSGKGRSRKNSEITLMFKNLLATHVYYHKHRERLSSWIKEARDCDALLVQAPLGLGKTMAISSALMENTKMSAIIFMPTTRMCKEMYDLFEGTDVFCIEGINPRNCDKFYSIMEQYNLKDFNRHYVCNRYKCEKRRRCRLIKQYEEARDHRIIITTHAQYKRFVQVDDDRLWNKNGKSVERDFFVIDENIVSTRFMHPVEVPMAELNRDCNILEDGSFEGPVAKNMKKLRDKVVELRESSLMAPIDRDFFISDKDREEWLELIKTTRAFNKQKIRNLIEYYCWAIRNGFTVRMKELRSFEPMQQVLYLHNVERPYQELKEKCGKKTPKHVFFDATEFRADDIFKEYFPADRVKKLSFDDVKSLGLLRVHHVNNENLSRTSFLFNTGKKREKTEAYLNHIIEKHGTKINYFVITTSAHEKHIVEYFERRKIYLQGDPRKQRSSNGYLVICHYGNQKGINDARHCRVGILLGTYFKPVEVNAASSLPHIRDLLDRDYKINGEVVHYNMTGRVYEDRFSSTLGAIDNWIRSIEHEQGMGRTRHLYHDSVDFYVVSRDEVKDYAIMRDAEHVVHDEGVQLFRRKKRTSRSPGSKAGSYDDIIFATMQRVAQEKQKFSLKEVKEAMPCQVDIRTIQKFTTNNPSKIRRIVGNLCILLKNTDPWQPLIEKDISI